ncbi:PLC-like phosphodiesterase [Bombardia bombarda]|uniref:PLC-like phosphodiesterase n=1 Tax=Bombardia bombarda TaxID=252184 RepID=A0AA39WIM3_9PEZI|nr:PLC-like phosphodiesterase [Bombardia bombarda]
MSMLLVIGRKWSLYHSTGPAALRSDATGTLLGGAGSSRKLREQSAHRGVVIQAHLTGWRARVGCPAPTASIGVRGVFTYETPRLLLARKQAPPLFTSNGTARPENMPLLQGKLPRASFAAALSHSTSNGATITHHHPLPQAIAHRGHKAAFPENSMAAFQAAVEIGAHAIETDLHLSKDGVVMLSHDASLKRCFGDDQKLADCDWEYLSTLRTLREPPQPMPRLMDLLLYLGKKENEGVWVLLDIKVDDDADELLGNVAKTLFVAPTSRPWDQRVVMGAWSQHYVDLCKKYLPTFPVAHIGVSLPYASRFLSQPAVDFNMLQPMLVGPAGACFMRAVKKAQRNLFVWTVNDEYWMEWSIRKQVDGVITDDPQLFLDVLERYKAAQARIYGDGGEGGEGVVNGGKLKRGVIVKTGSVKRAKLYARAAVFQLLGIVLVLWLWRRFSTMKGGKKRVAGPVKV